MAKRNIDVIKSWFGKGCYPTAAQFSDSFDSFYHKDELIPISVINGLQETLNGINSGGSSAEITNLSNKVDTKISAAFVKFGGFDDKERTGMNESYAGLDGTSPSVIKFNTVSKSFIIPKPGVPNLESGWEAYPWWNGGGNYGTSAGTAGVIPFDNILYLDVTTRKLYFYDSEYGLIEANKSADPNLITSIVNALSNITGMSVAELKQDTNSMYLSPAAVSKTVTVLRFGGFVESGVINANGVGADDVECIKFYPGPNLFCYELNGTLNNSWISASKYGSTELGGVVPSEEIYYLDITTGTLYRYNGGTLVECES